MPAATAEVAHAPLAGCHRLRRRAQTCATRRSAPDGISDVGRRASGVPSPWFSDSDLETADAARGAATKSGGWRHSGTLSCQSKLMLDEQASAKAGVASLSTPTTRKLRRRITSGAFYSAHETHLAGVTRWSEGVSTPPLLRPVPSRGRPGGLLTPRCRCRDVCALSLRPARRFRCVGACVHAVDLARNSLNFQ